MIRLITRDQIAAALQREAAGTPLPELISESGASRRAFLRMRKRYLPLSDLLRDLRNCKEENIRLQSVITDLTLDMGKLMDQLYPR